MKKKAKTINIVGLTAAIVLISGILVSFFTGNSNNEKISLNLDDYKITRTQLLDIKDK